MNEAKELLTERRDRVGILTLNRPERRNALSPRLLIGLHEALEAWVREEEIRTVVIRGAGEKAFSAGYDILAIPTDVTPETASRLRDRNPLQLALGFGVQAEGLDGLVHPGAQLTIPRAVVQLDDHRSPGHHPELDIDLVIVGRFDGGLHPGEGESTVPE